jgi:hypothetical protein
MKTVLVAPIAAAILVAACSAQTPDDASSAASEIHGGSVCAPLDYPHVLSNADFFRQFESDAAAGEYLTKIIAQGQLAPISGPDARFREITQDARLLRLVGEVYEGFKRVFPSDVAGLPTPPRVAIVESDIKNAFALGPGYVEDAQHRHDQSPWLFIVHTALINEGGTDTELRGLFAHELGHLILRNALPEVRQAIRSIYLIAGSEDGIIGEAQTDEGPLAAHVEEMLKRQQRVGGVPELGLPVFAALGATYPKITDMLLGLATPDTGASSAACADAKTKEAALQNAQKALIPGITAGNLVPRAPTAEESAHLEELSQATASALRTCLEPMTAGPSRASLMQLTAAMNELPEGAADPSHPDHAKLLGLMLDDEKAVDADLVTAPLIDRMLKAQAPIRSEFIALRASPTYPIDEVRVYDFEEDADDAAVRVLHAIGDDPLGIGKFLLDALMTPAEKASCLADVAAHRAVPYGRFIDTHPATCWRYYHAKQFAEALGTCSSVATTARSAPKGSGRPSVTFLPPRELTEKGYGRGQR